ncbi:hypothetical protein EUGRSUZ_F00754 [Eucalyptus grandis]|uniref:Uncharacterized protein n=2 Tax=Eucalyptus grandis TaxID=71139 RepID=A0A059BMT3_EUCGR|nr:hypothetical protein EUGRSUZ_F00754 [Eucalyptus grandis]
MSDESVVARHIHEGIATAAADAGVQALQKPRSVSNEPFPREATRAPPGAAEERRRRIGHGNLELGGLVARAPGRVGPGRVGPRERVRLVRAGADPGVPEPRQRPRLQVPILFGGCKATNHGGRRHVWRCPIRIRHVATTRTNIKKNEKSGRRPWTSWPRERRRRSSMCVVRLDLEIWALTAKAAFTLYGSGDLIYSWRTKAAPWTLA